MLRLLSFWPHQAVHVLLQQLFVLQFMFPLSPCVICTLPPILMLAIIPLRNQDKIQPFHTAREGQEFAEDSGYRKKKCQPKLWTKKFPKSSISGVFITNESYQHPQIYREIIHGDLYLAVLGLYSHVHCIPPLTTVCNFTNLRPI